MSQEPRDPQAPHLVDGKLAPHWTHVWKEDRPQTRCKQCGAYRHLGSGFWPCRITDAPLAAKKKLSVLFHENPDTPEGKYLVKRRDGGVVESPTFCLLGADPMAPWTLRFYSLLGFCMGHFDWSLVRSMWRFARQMVKWRKENGRGDPGMGKHRRDDPATLAEMKKGRSA